MTFHWGILLTSLLLGFAIGWIAVVYRGRGTSRRVARWLGVLVAVLLTLSLARLVPGRFGYWLDLGLVMFATYLIGCGAGSWLRDRIVHRQAPLA